MLVRLYGARDHVRGAALDFDDEQRAVLAHPTDRPLLVLGGAGSGKTTVALHRLARCGPPRQLLVIVPEPGLAAVARARLADLGLRAAQVATFDEWIAARARRLLPDLPRPSVATPAAVVRLKRHPALLRAMPRLVDRLIGEAGARLDRALAGRGRLAARLRGHAAETLAERLDAVEEETLERDGPRLWPEVRAAFADERRRLRDVHDDLLGLLGDRAVLDELIAASAGGLSAGHAARVAEHAGVQLSRPTVEAFLDVDHERRRPIDGLDLDAGTPDEDAGAADLEDYALCLELLRRKGGPGDAPVFRHVLVDEAQDLAAVELAAVGHAVGPGGGLTICGDRSQQIDDDAGFVGWDEALAALGAAGATPIELRTSYRCTAPILDYAHAVLGRLAPSAPPRPIHDGPPVTTHVLADEDAAMAALAEALADLRAREPTTSAAVIARGPELARRAHRRLPPALGARLILGDDPAPGRGLAVTTVAQVKGLELDVVVALAAGYDDGDEARRQLHVACTRARAMLWVLAWSPCPILPRSALQ
jgi:DNA helicase II / ATP-dependent DNA helicase PcrA